MRRALRARSVRRGVTLTEILIAIMILGIGLVSLATLFPIGLLRLREAQRYSRAAFLAQSAGADIASRGLLSKSSFLDPTSCPWYSENYYGVALYPFGFDPWIQDTPAPTADWLGYGDPSLAGAYRGTGGRGAKFPNQTNDPTGINKFLPAVPGPGLPVAYDPLWWYRQGLVPDPTNGVEYRFASGASLGLADGSGGDAAGVASAWGLQRVTNLPMVTYDSFAGGYTPSVYNANMILSTFISPEDVVWQSNDGVYEDYQDPTDPVGPLATPSPVVPDLTPDPTASDGLLPQITNDWRYTCMFVGQQTDSYNGRMFDGDVVVFENRPFGFDPSLNFNPLKYPNPAAGERVVQAVFGYGTNLVQVGQMLDGNNTAVGLALGANNAVLLLWPSVDANGNPMLDLEVKPGSWIADVTYERRHMIGQSRFQYDASTSLFPGVTPPPPPGQRCYWYQVQRATPPADTAGTPFAAFGAGRYMLVYTSTNLRAKTLWNVSNGVPYHVNAALVSPSVVAVAPRTIVAP